MTYPPTPGRTPDGAALEAEVDACRAVSRAATRTLLELSPEASELFRRHMQSEMDRLKLAGPGAPELALMRLKTLMRG